MQRGCLTVGAALSICLASAHALADQKYDGTWQGPLVGSCAFPLTLIVTDGIAHYRSPVSGANVAGPIQSDGTFMMTSPVMGNYGTTNVEGRFEGDQLSGNFAVKNPYHPCTATFTAKRQLAPAMPSGTDAQANSQSLTSDLQVLTGEQLKALIPGNEMTAVNSRGQRYTESYQPDGSMTAVSTSAQGLISDSGQWSIDGADFCVQYRNWQDGRKHCNTIEKTPTGYRTGYGTPIVFKKM